MSDSLKHECGIALVRLLKPLEYYKKKYGSAFYGINKMYLLIEKQHNRGQDGAGFASIKTDMQPGERYISLIRSKKFNPIQDIFSQINGRISNILKENPTLLDDIALQKKLLPYIGELFLGHIRYGTSGENSIESVQPFLRQNNWMHRNLIIAGNFNMTNLNELFDKLVSLGQHPKEKVDTITVMEKIGHFLDDAVRKLYKELKREGYSKKQASPMIAKRLRIDKILKKASKNWDGGYAMAGLLGHGDAFVIRDPAGIRPCYYYHDEEVVVVTSERPPIQTAFNVSFDKIKELDPGKAIIIKSDGKVEMKTVIPPLEKKSCSFERIYFSRGSDAEIYAERKKLGELMFPKILENINNEVKDTVFSYIPNTSETSFLGMIKAAQDYMNKANANKILAIKDNITPEAIDDILQTKPRIEKIAIKDAKLRTFITEDTSRDDLVAHVYDITYGAIKSTDNLVIIDDSIVRGTTLKKSILKMLDRLNPKRIVVVSSAPQIRYPDCYGIDMANLQDLIAFKATLELYRDSKNYQEVIDKIYEKCKEQVGKKDKNLYNAVQEFYEPFSADEISNKISQMLSKGMKSEVSIIFQSISSLHQACPKNTGDWYFTGNYPTPGGNRVSNRAFMNFYEGIRTRAY